MLSKQFFKLRSLGRPRLLCRPATAHLRPELLSVSRSFALKTSEEELLLCHHPSSPASFSHDAASCPSRHDGQLVATDACNPAAEAVGPLLLVTRELCDPRD
ncbi:hypothetical protein T4B_1612 [Trichinella pseudospiralis]|uniref:Uncharacterized protein n=2 Tax=Trichinella pseudospiralis TaxID=6337 RepID=A0A0V1FKW3_TRIPS|nr:hypothetical protein T4A_1623 [Trichinella pseudospiralis]KRY86694.1 hypothetical protein T4D_15647 [Trichinella pseudospiralis]KRZ32241.1 hypothetical protein T4B_1612 [Trichinella pseudospiralis]KRZ39001.1 hypothetical protein T4C_709 [Trichinella pseudospiralis]